MTREVELFRIGLSGKVSGFVSAMGTHVNSYKLEFKDNKIIDSKKNEIKIVPLWEKETIKLFNEIKKETKRTVITWVILNEYLRENIKTF